jgi:hypothetical protein
MTKLEATMMQLMNKVASDGSSLLLFRASRMSHFIALAIAVFMGGQSPISRKRQRIQKPFSFNSIPIVMAPTPMADWSAIPAAICTGLPLKAAMPAGTVWYSN